MRVNLLLPEKDKKEIDDIKLGEFMKKEYQDYYLSRNLTFTV